MPTHPYDSISIDSLRKRTGVKWNRYANDVIPLWIAEMDFPTAPPIIEALQDCLDRGDFGYGNMDGYPGVREAVADRLAKRYGATVPSENIRSLSSTVVGLTRSINGLTAPGDEILILTPLYPPFKNEILAAGRVPVEVQLVQQNGEWNIDFDALQAAVTPATRMLMFCSPHNPVGKIFSQTELEQVADFVLRNNLWFVSDDLHADITFGEANYIPMMNISEEIAARTITVYGPTKAFNMPGLPVSFMMTHNAQLLERVQTAIKGYSGSPSPLAETAALAAYEHGDAWLADTLAYIKGNRDFVARELATHLPDIGVTVPQGTYLLWLDLNGLGLGDEETSPSVALESTAKVVVQDGAMFGLGGKGFARMNVATSRPILEEALARLRGALQ